MWQYRWTCWLRCCWLRFSTLLGCDVLLREGPCMWIGSELLPGTTHLTRRPGRLAAAGSCKQAASRQQAGSKQAAAGSKQAASRQQAGSKQAASRQQAGSSPHMCPRNLGPVLDPAAAQHGSTSVSAHRCQHISVSTCQHIAACVVRHIKWPQGLSTHHTHADAPPATICSHPSPPSPATAPVYEQL